MYHRSVNRLWYSVVRGKLSHGAEQGSGMNLFCLVRFRRIFSVALLVVRYHSQEVLVRQTFAPRYSSQRDAADIPVLIHSNATSLPMLRGDGVVQIPSNFGHAGH
jgi:hypothetical protein